jgi:nucleoid-associated protein YgaU
MTDRGLPIVDGAPACPFVAFEDDRDARATSPDYRHRCYAEVRPAPRALAHQEAYCLSSAFPVCPTFQDWARREAARAKATGSRGPSPGPPADDGYASGAAEGDDAEGDAAGAAAGAAAAGAAAGAAAAGAAAYAAGDPRGAGLTSPGLGERNPPRNWAAPPPWLSSHDDPEGDDREIAPGPPVRGAGLSGSFADRLAGGSGPRPAAPPGMPPNRDVAATAEQAPVAPALPGPSWERPRRMEAYPTLKTRIGLPSVALPPVIVAVAAVVIAAVALFFLPALLGIGNPSGTASSPSPSVGVPGEASGSPGPATPTPGPTQQIYIVKEGDTMSRIANAFGVTLSALVDANKDTIPNPDLLEIGQEVIIPTVAPTSLPDAGASPSPS